MKNSIKKHLIALIIFNFFWAFTLVPFGIFAQKSRSRESNQESVLSLLDIELEKQLVRFGDKAQLQVTLQNTGTSPITLPPGSLLMSCVGWNKGGASSTFEGAINPLTIKEKPQAPIIIAPGKSVVLWAEDEEAPSIKLGEFNVTYSLSTETPTLKKLLPKKAEKTIAITITPSELISAIWAADTDEARQRLFPQIRALLKQESAAKDDEGWSLFRRSVEYLGEALFPILEMVFDDDAPLIRKQVIKALGHPSLAISHFNSFLEENKNLDWTAHLKRGDSQLAFEIGTKLASKGLDDKDAGVRSAAIEWFTQMRNEDAFQQIKQLAFDKDARVREVAQKYISLFASQKGATDLLFTALSDANAKVREEAITALEHTEMPPSLEALTQAFKISKDSEAIRLLDLLFEQENATMPAILLDGFKKRSPQERLKIMTLIAGYTGDAAFELVKLGLPDTATSVQQAALMRLIAFPSTKSLPILAAYESKIPAQLKPLAQAVRTEIERRQQFPFASAASDDLITARETVFPSQNGTVPMVSPDGQWVAYVETGWGRPGGSGGMGRSNLMSLTHVVKSDGKDDRIVSDMFLVQWLADSKKVASARDGYMAITDLDGKALTEFGQPLGEEELKYQRGKGDWREGYIREQMGRSMPHTKRIPISFESIGESSSIRDWGEDAAFSPDSKWFGPILERRKIVFFDENWQRLSIALPKEYYVPEWQCSWSPDGRYVLMIPIGENDDGFYQTYLIDFQARTLRTLADVDSIPNLSDWGYRKSRWNPWSKDGSRLAFVRKGQIWVTNADGSNPGQITFDNTRKLSPVFSRDGKRIAYISWLPDNRRHYERTGPTDVWVVDIDSTLAARVTAPAKERINCLDWLDHNTLIFDRLEGDLSHKSSLRVVSLLTK